MKGFFNKFLDKTQSIRYFGYHTQTALQQFFRRENLAFQEAKAHIPVSRKLYNFKNFILYIGLGYFAGECIKNIHYVIKYGVSILGSSEGSWVSSTLYSDTIPLPRRTLIKMNDEMMEYSKKEEQDLLTYDLSLLLFLLIYF